FAESGGPCLNRPVALLRRRRESEPKTDDRPRRLADDAPRMRDALAAIHAERERLDGERGQVNLRAITEDLLAGEVQAPTRDVAWLIRKDTDAAAFYEKEIAPSWEGLGEAQRAARLEGFVDLARML